MSRTFVEFVSPAIPDAARVVVACGFAAAVMLLSGCGDGDSGSDSASNSTEPGADAGSAQDELGLSEGADVDANATDTPPPKREVYHFAEDSTMSLELRQGDRTIAGGFRNLSGQVIFLGDDVVSRSSRLNIDTSALFLDDPALEQWLKDGKAVPSGGSSTIEVVARKVLPQEETAKAADEAEQAGEAVAAEPEPSGADAPTSSAQQWQCIVSAFGNRKVITFPLVVQRGGGRLLLSGESTVERSLFGLTQQPDEPSEKISNSVTVRMELRGRVGTTSKQPGLTRKDDAAGRPGTVGQTRIVGGASTNRGEDARNRIMARYDTDGDGSLSETERETMRAAATKRLDKNGNGVIDESERPAPAVAEPAAVPASSASAPPKSVPSDGEKAPKPSSSPLGRPSPLLPEQPVGKPSVKTSRVDSSRTSRRSLTSGARAAAKPTAKQKSAGDDKDCCPDRYDPTVGPGQHPSVTVVFAGLDQNEDGQITETELGIGHWQLFRPADTDQSSSISLEEMTKWHAGIP